MTNKLSRRFQEHNNNQSFYTSREVPWNLVWYTVKPTRVEAYELERKLKNISSNRRLLQFMRNNPVNVSLDDPPLSDVQMRTRR